MTDNITLPREVVEQARFAMKRRISRDGPLAHEGDIAALVALDAALAEPDAKPDVLRRWVNANDDAPETEFQRGYDAARRWVRNVVLPALAEPVHPGYVIGSHWLETAYSRIAAGEAEADVLAEALGARGWVKPEPATDEQVTEAYIAPEVDALWRDFAVGFRAAERFHGVKKEDKT